MQLSLNEIHVESRKAARGAGLPWGLTEEVGQAMAWLAERGIDALPAMLEILESCSCETSRDDPIRIGTEIADRAQQLMAGDILTFPASQHPILLLPFLAMASRLTGREIALHHAEGSWLLSPGHATAGVLTDAVRRRQIGAVRCQAGGPQAMAPFIAPTRMLRLEIAPLVCQQVQ